MFLSSDPLLQHHPLSPLFSSHRCCYSECMMPAYSRETSELSSSRHETRYFASHTASYLHSSSFHIPKKQGCRTVKPAVCSSRQRTRKREMSVVLFYSKSVMFHHRPCTSVVASLLHIPPSQNTAVCISFCLSPFHSVSKVGCTCSV